MHCFSCSCCFSAQCSVGRQAPGSPSGQRPSTMRWRPPMAAAQLPTCCRRDGNPRPNTPEDSPSPSPRETLDSAPQSRLPDYRPAPPTHVCKTLIAGSTPAAASKLLSCTWPPSRTRAGLCTGRVPTFAPTFGLLAYLPAYLPAKTSPAILSAASSCRAGMACE